MGFYARNLNKSVSMDILKNLKGKFISNSSIEDQRHWRIIEEKILSVLPHTPIVIWRSNEEGITSYISSNVEKIYGYTPNEIYSGEGKLWFERIHPDDINEVEQAFSKLLTEGAEYNVEYRIQRKDGLWISLHDESITVYELDDKKFAIGFFTDITERKRLENELLEERERCQLLIQNIKELLTLINEQGIFFIELNESITNNEVSLLQLYIDKVNHELRTPITCIQTAAELIKRNSCLSNEEKMRLHQIIDKNIDRLIKVIDILIRV
jgi:PAS domain S-box-containing protein